MPIEFCPVDRQYLYTDVNEFGLSKFCRSCGYRRQEDKGGLIVDTPIQNQAMDEYKYIVNEFTKEDPRLPHYKNLKCKG